MFGSEGSNPFEAPERSWRTAEELRAARLAAARLAARDTARRTIVTGTRESVRELTTGQHQSHATVLRLLTDFEVEQGVAIQGEDCIKEAKKILGLRDTSSIYTLELHGKVLDFQQRTAQRFNLTPGILGPLTMRALFEYKANPSTTRVVLAAPYRMMLGSTDLAADAERRVPRRGFLEALRGLGPNVASLDTDRLSGTVSGGYGDGSLDDVAYYNEYVAASQRLAQTEPPLSIVKLREKFDSLSPQDIERGFRGHMKKDKILQNISKIKEYAQAGLERAARSAKANNNYEISEKDCITIFLPNVDRSLALGITYAPGSQRLEIYPYGFGQNGFGNRTDSHETPLGTRRVTDISVGRDPDQIVNNWQNIPQGRTAESYGRGYEISPDRKKFRLVSMYSAAITTSGIERGLNTHARSVATHGINSSRSERLQRGDLGNEGSWGCSIMTQTQIRRISALYRAGIAAGGRAYEETWPPVTLR